MKTSLVIRATQEYYGLTYSPGMLRVVEQYLDNLPEELLPHLMARVFRLHSASYKALPDVAIFESALPLAWEALIESRPRNTLAIEAPGAGEIASDADLEAFEKFMKQYAPTWRFRR